MANFKFAHINVRSLVPKIEVLKQYMRDHEIDVLAVSETWLNQTIQDEVVCIKGFNVIRKDRVIGRGGGVLVYVRDCFKFSEINYIGAENSEQIWIEVIINKMKYAFGVLYRPPNGDITNFLQEYEENLCKILLNYKYMISTGDFNINMMDIDNTNCQQFLSILSAYNLTQSINEPTRVGNNTSSLLDLMISSEECSVVQCTVDCSFNISDHFVIKLVLNLKVYKPPPLFYTYRDYKRINHEQFLVDLYNTPFHNVFYIRDVDSKLEKFNDLLIDLFNKHAPERTVRITKKKAPWITENIKLIMSNRDKALSKYKKQKTSINWENYRHLRNRVTSLIQIEKQNYLANQVRTNNTKDNWKLLKEMGVINKENDIVTNALGTSDEINNFFINSVQHTLPEPETISFYLEHKVHNAGNFEFRMATEEDIVKAISLIRTRAIGPDGIGLTMILHCCPYIIPIILHLVNICIETSCFPSSWKNSYVLPLPKIKHPNEIKDLRPISILPTLSKIVERILEWQIREYIADKGILPDVQSGFRKHHSCTTALTKVTDDILTAIDHGELTALVLLDYSKAFDTINYNLLTAILNYIGFSKMATRLIGNYLSGRTQAVRFNGEISQRQSIKRGVPQGSILGPLLFSIYTFNLVTCLQSTIPHVYADDTQIYLSFKPDNIEEANIKVTCDLALLLKVSKSHCLEINPTKSKILLFGPMYTVKKYRHLLDVKLLNKPLPICQSSTNLGLILDTGLRFSEHVNKCIKKAFGNLKLIYSQRSILNQHLRKLLCDSLVLSQFNYCDTVYGPCLRQYDSNRIQLIQNSCVRLIKGIRRGDHGISAALRELNWLTMAERRNLHSMVLFNKIITEKSPQYLYNKIMFRVDIHSMNVRDKYTITIPKHITASYERSFSYQIAHMYNNIPETFRLLRGHKFKTYVRDYITRSR